MNYIQRNPHREDPPDSHRKDPLAPILRHAVQAIAPLRMFADKRTSRKVRRLIRETIAAK